MKVRVPTREDFSNYDGLHCRNLWAKVGENWRCPACSRSKFQILRWTARFPSTSDAFEDWVAILHRHHDHSQGSLPADSDRFPETVICDQCNSADGAAKRKLKLPSNFSFSPEEIAQFVTATPHSQHKIDFGVAKAIFDSLLP